MSPAHPPSPGSERPGGRSAPGAADRSLGDTLALLAELTGDLDPDQVEPLRQARQLEAFYPLLHALVGRSLRDFLVRVAALECLVEAEQPAFLAPELAQLLYWLDPVALDTTLAALRREGWLDHVPGLGTRVSDAGRWGHAVLAFLRRRQGEAELLPTVEGLNYALDIGGLDPVHHLRALRSRLVALREEIEQARATHSEVLMRRTQERLGDALRLSERIRAVLDRVPVDNAAARAICRDVHDLLSRLHGASAELHAAVTEVGRQYLRLTAGLTTEQVVRSLMARSSGELGALGQEALHAIFVPPPLIDTDVLAASAEQQALRERPDPAEVEWSEPAAAPRAEDVVDLDPAVRAFLAELAAVAESGSEPALAELVPREEAGLSFLRASLLALVGAGAAEGEGVPARLGALPLALVVEDEAWPEPLPEGGPLASLSTGRLRRTKAVADSSAGSDP